MKRLFVVFFLIHASHGFSQKDSLQIVSWNVFLRPSFLRDGQLERVGGIGDYLNKTQADVLVLQEVFHNRARKRLIEALQANYPYQTKVGKTSFFGVSSGVLIFSKLPIRNERHIYFKRAILADRLAVKGGVLAEIDFHGLVIDIIGTHLQAGGGETGIEIRKEQLKDLLQLTAEDRPTVFAGDFNIAQQSDAFGVMLEILNCETVDPAGQLRYTANFSDHGLMKSSGLPKWIDFILTRRLGNVKIVDSYIEQPMYQVGEAFERLSDHNPIVGFVH